MLKFLPGNVFLKKKIDFSAWNLQNRFFIFYMINCDFSYAYLKIESVSIFNTRVDMYQVHLRAE